MTDVLTCLLFGIYSVLLTGVGFYVGRMAKWKESHGLPPTDFKAILPNAKEEEEPEFPLRNRQKPLSED